MRTSELIAILARRLADHGDQEIAVNRGRGLVLSKITEVSDDRSAILFLRAWHPLDAPDETP